MTVRHNDAAAGTVRCPARPCASGVIAVSAAFIGIGCCAFFCPPAARGSQCLDADGNAHVVGTGQAAAQQDRKKEKAARQKSIENLKRITLAMQDYHDANKRMPPHAFYSNDGKTPLLSWRVVLLPYLNQVPLYRKFKLDEPWSSEHNKALIAQIPAIYEPVGSKAKREGKTYYQVFAGSPITTPKTRITLAAIANLNGASNTLAVVEAKNAVTWTKPEDIAFPKADAKRLPVGGLFDDRWHAAFCDGSVRALRIDMPVGILRKMILWTNNEPFDVEKYEKNDGKP